MTPFAKNFDKAYAKVLIRIAEGDLRTAEILEKNPGGRIENTLYHTTGLHGNGFRVSRATEPTELKCR